MNINDLSNKAARYIVSGIKEEDSNKEKVIAYGIFAIIHTAISIGSVIIIGLLFGVLVEALIISCTIAFLRKATGGAHMGTPELCAILGTVVAVGFALISQTMSLEVYSSIVIGGIVFALSYYAVYKLAPVESKAKPIRRAEKRILLKKKSVFILSTYLVIVAGVIVAAYIKNDMQLLNYAMCIYLAVSWQTVTLTKVGHDVLGKIDHSLRYHFSRKENN